MALTYEGITVMAVAHEQPTWTKVAEQANNPILQLEAADAPPVGQRWDWSVTGGGLDPLNNTFTSQPTVEVVAVYDSGMRAEIRIADIIDADWQANASGNLKLHIERSDSPTTYFYDPIVKVSARCVTTIDFTVFQGQSEAGTMNVSAAPGATASTRYDWSAPAPHALHFTGIGGAPFDTVISVREAVLSATTNAQPASPVRGDRYILPVGAVGAAWVGNDRKIAEWNGAAWSFETPAKGWICYSEGDVDCYYMNGTPGPSGNWVTGLDTAAGAVGFDFDAADAAKRYGRIAVSGWTGEWADFAGNFSLTIKEVDGTGTQTSSESRFCTSGGAVATPNIRLRRLVGDGYTAFAGQATCGDGVFAYTGTKDLIFAPTCPTDVSFTVDNMGRLQNLSVSDSGLWGTDLTFDLEVTDGANRPSSFFKSYPAVPAKNRPRALSLRRLNHTTFFWFVSQTTVAGQTKVNADPATGMYSWTLVDGSGALSMANSGAKNENVAISATSGASGANTAFSLEIADGARPVSVVGATLRRRHVEPDPADIPYAAGGGSAALQVKSGVIADAGPWDFGAMTIAPPALDATLDGAASTDSATTAITWTALDPAGGSGTATFTIAPHDGSAPPCTVGIGVNAAAQIPVEPDGVDVAILVDRSGSMSSQNRWKAAMSGAKLFAELVREATGQTVTADPYPGSGTHTWTTVPHRAGLAWFWGRRNPGNTPNFPNPTPPEPGYPEGFHNWFTDAAGDSYRLPDGASLAKLDTISAESPTGTLAEQGPGNLTALGSGMLFCRNALVAAADPVTSNRERVLLVLSDGMENRRPLLSDLFNGSQTGLWYRREGNGDDIIQNPKIKLHAAALLTGANWAERLRDAVQENEGEPALDVKHITDYTTFPTTIQNWFVHRFRDLFGFTQPDAAPDPELAQGQVATRSIPVTLGHSRLIFYVLFGQPDAGKWEIGVVPPGQDGAIYHRLAAGYAGIRVSGGEMYKTIAVDLPLAVPGHGHRWAGEWKLVVSREGAGSGSYATGVLARQEERTGLEISAPSTPRPGDRVRLRAVVRDRDGEPVTDAAVVTRVHEPGPWPGDAVAREVGSNLALVKRLRQSAKQADEDMPEVADRMLRHLHERAALGRGRTRRIALAHAGNGVYEAEILLANPGAHDLDTTVTGSRETGAAEFEAKLRKAVAALPAHYPAAALAAERAWLARTAGAGQPFRSELRHQLAVAFLPTVKDSETGGYFADAETIRLLVQPAGKGGVLLGPGFADAIRFLAPGQGLQTWPATDLGDGNYQVEIAVRRRGDVRFDRLRLALAAERFALVHPVAGPVELRDGLLELARFEAEVLGVRLPIAVLSLVGNARTRECHLISCPFGEKIAAKNKVWLHDLEHARRCGYDTCEHCLPLICNTDPEHMEAHKPFCRWARKIKPGNRLEVHRWKQAEELGFDGCWYCLRKHHHG